MRLPLLSRFKALTGPISYKDCCGKEELGTEGFEPPFAGLEPAALARLNYVPLSGKNLLGAY